MFTFPPISFFLLQVAALSVHQGAPAGPMGPVRDVDGCGTAVPADGKVMLDSWYLPRAYFPVWAA